MTASWRHPDHLGYFVDPMLRRCRDRRLYTQMLTVYNAVSYGTSVSGFLSATDDEFLAERTIGPTRLKVVHEMQRRIRARQDKLLEAW